LVLNEEFLVNVSHNLTLITSLPFAALDLNTQLRVTFSQPAGEFSYCDATYKPVGFNRSLSDTDVSLVYFQPWDLRSYRPGPNKTKAVTSYAPQISWNNVTDARLYTLLVVDPIFIFDPTSAVGPFLNHYMVININNTNFNSGMVINPYFGPAPLDSLYHKYVFLLYRQQSLITLSPAEITKLQTRKNFNLTTFVQNFTLGNPVGVNWAFAQADLWSAVAQDYIGFKKTHLPRGTNSQQPK